MNLLLSRKQRTADGIFGTLENESFSCVTLEHAYEGAGGWIPKIPKGTYTCRRGLHRLHGMTEAFETFEITGVEGHSDLLFHWGNFNKDSEGCVLLGDALAKNGPTGTQMILHSRDTFAKFMRLQDGVEEFQLVVTLAP